MSKMKKRKILTTTTLIILFCLVYLISEASSHNLRAEVQAATRVVKIETDYWIIEAMTKFNAKGNTVAFNHPNSGTKKIEPGQQVLGVQFALYNPSDKDIKVRRNDFIVNDAKINHFIVQEKTTQPLVVTVAAGKAIGITNYYIVSSELQDIQSLKVIYTSVDKAYKKLEVGIPLSQEK